MIVSMGRSIFERHVDGFTGMRFPAAAEDFPFGFFNGRKDRFALDLQRLRTIRRHLPKNPFGERFSANEDHLLPRRVEPKGIQQTPQAGAVPANWGGTKFLDKDPVFVWINPVPHATPHPRNVTAGIKCCHYVLTRVKWILGSSFP
jgi:hypothetical protein